jgi:hypothetical protein
MPQVGFEPTISADERPQTYTIDRAATGTGKIKVHGVKTSLYVILRIVISPADWFGIEHGLRGDRQATGYRSHGNNFCFTVATVGHKVSNLEQEFG